LKNGTIERYNTEGLNTVKYELIETVITPLYTKFVVYYDEEQLMANVKKNFNLTAALEDERRYWRELKAKKNKQNKNKENSTLPNGS
jgi:hypothetical protein